MPTSVYYVSISGFDTHFNQVNQQERLLKNYADSVNVFVNDLKNESKEILFNNFEFDEDS